MRLSGLWRHPDFVRLWTASAVSVFGLLITRTALPFAAILVLDASPSQVGLLRLAELLPGFVLGLVAGAWVDRRRRPLMIGADLARAAILLAVPLAALLGRLSLPLLVAVAALTSVGNVVFDVAYQSFLPSLIRRDQLVEGNAKISAAWSVAETTAFGLGGWLVQWLTAPFAILVDAITFVVSALFVGAIRAPEPLPAPTSNRDESPRRALIAEIAAGLWLVGSDAGLRALLGASAGLAFSFGVGGAVFLIYVNQVLGFEPGVLGLVFALGGVSSFAGAVLAGRLAAWPIGPVLVACFVLAAVGQALVPLATSAGAVGLALLIAQQFVSDPAYTVYDINQVSLRQGTVADALQGRVNATFRVGEVGGQIAGTLAGGYVGDAVGARAALWLGVGVLLLAALWLFSSPVRGLRRLQASVVEAAP